MQTKIQSLLASLFLPLIATGTIVLVLTVYLPSQAAVNGTYTVNTTLDNLAGPCDLAHCSLREAILAANNTSEADTVVFSLPPSSTITLNGTQLPIITGTLIIDGSTAENLTISGDDASRVFVIGSAPPPYPAAPESSASSTLGSSTAVTLTNLTVTKGNEAFHLGGAIFNDGALTVIDSAITHTTSKHGAIYNSNTLVISNSTFISNSVIAGFGGGAGIYNNDTGVVTVTNSAFINNTAVGSEVAGGGIYNQNGVVTISGSVFRGNYATWFGGGAIRSAYSGELNISNSVFINNSTTMAYGRGGALWAIGSVNITDSTFRGNSADEGGAIWTYDFSSDVLILNSTFYDNSADSDGGAVHINSSASIANSTLSGNSAQRGGGIFVGGFDGALTTNNNTITGNSASSNGGGVFNLGILHMSNNIIANSVGLTDCFSTTAIGTNVNNLVEDGSCNAPLSGDPLLGPLQDNDGDTLTHALLQGSPAIDAGHDATCAAAPVNNLDQRGYVRPVDGDDDGAATCDIGSFEAGQPPDIYLNKNGPATAVPGEYITYTLTVINNLPIPVADVVLTDTIPANATYISGGTQVGGVVSWTLPSLAAGAAFTRSFFVTATETITNDDYRVSASGNYSTTGNTAVVTIIEPEKWTVYLPIILKPAATANQPSQPDSQNLTAYLQNKVANIPRRPGSPGFLPD